ncbi:MAG TPA: patatin-like phospholipase family protein [Thermoanaerobaculia bacterium]|nr:patatin-like phospholipase family protein [Thermoanaerobaculia bacterium]
MGGGGSGGIGGIGGSDGSDRIGGSAGQAHALVLSGGGAKGAYEVGVMKALFAGASQATDHRPIEIDIYTGTSVGSYNATWMAAQGDLPSLAAVERLERTWRTRVAATMERCGNGVYRVRGLPLQGLDPGCFLHPVEALAELSQDAVFLSRAALIRGLNFLVSKEPCTTRAADLVDLASFISPAPLYHLVAETIDFDRLRTSSKSLTIAASNWVHGTLQLFPKADIALRHGQPVLASAAIPGFFPPIMIDGVPYVDGGLTLNTPLKPAIDLGADVLHVIYLDPATEDIPFPTLPNTMDTMYRMYAILIANAMQDDLVVADFANQLLLLGLDWLPEKPAGATGRPPLRIQDRPMLRDGRPVHRPLIIHRYRPSTDMGGLAGLLDFSTPVIDRFIALGESDAKNHDCRREGCSLAAGLPAGSAPAAAAGRRP